MIGVGGGTRWVRNIERLAERINKRSRAKRKRPKGSGKPVGPKLIRGRGLLRRRPKNRIEILVYLLVAAGLSILIGRYILLPILT